jgi:hypothetical protein
VSTAHGVRTRAPRLAAAVLLCLVMMASLAPVASAHWRSTIFSGNCPVKGQTEHKVNAKRHIARTEFQGGIGYECDRVAARAFYETYRDGVKKYGMCHAEGGTVAVTEPCGDRYASPSSGRYSAHRYRRIQFDGSKRWVRAGRTHGKR